MKFVTAPSKSKMLHLRQQSSSDRERRRSSDPSGTRSQNIVTNNVGMELAAGEISVPCPIVKISEVEGEEIRSSSDVVGETVEGSTMDLGVKSPPSVFEGKNQGLGIHPDLDDSSRKILNNLHDIMFGMLEHHDLGAVGDGIGEMQRVIYWRQVQIATSSLFLVIGVVLFFWMLMDNSDFNTHEHQLKPT